MPRCRRPAHRDPFDLDAWATVGTSQGETWWKRSNKTRNPHQLVKQIGKYRKVVPSPKFQDALGISMGPSLCQHNGGASLEDKSLADHDDEVLFQRP